MGRHRLPVRGNFITIGPMQGWDLFSSVGFTVLQIWWGPQMSRWRRRKGLRLTGPGRRGLGHCAEPHGRCQAEGGVNHGQGLDWFPREGRGEVGMQAQDWQE